LVVFDLAQEAETKTNDFSNTSLIIPREMLEDQIKPDTDSHMKTISGSEPMVQLLRDHMLSLKRLSGEMTAQQAVELAPATVGLVAACLNASIGDNPDQRSGVTMAQMTMIRRFIESRLSHPEMSAAYIARKMGMSRSKLYQLFESYDGVANYVRDRRLRRALFALPDKRMAHRPIYDIALASGYTSDTAFSRAFRLRYGLSPNDFRQGGAVSVDTKQNADGIDRRYENWLKHLSV
jgi:AraC-like DNA-binding protein